MIKYTVNGNVTTAEIEACEMDAIDIMRRRSELVDYIIESSDVTAEKVFGLHLNKYFMPYKIQAKVTCKPEDTFNEAEGKRQARMALMKKRRDMINKRLKAFKKDIINIGLEVTDSEHTSSTIKLGNVQFSGLFELQFS